jgi:hypothetical protein
MVAGEHSCLVEEKVVVSVPASGGAWLARASMCESSIRHVGPPS